MDRITIDFDSKRHRVVDRGLERKPGRPGTWGLQQHEFVDHRPKITGFRRDLRSFSMVLCGLENGVERGEDRSTMSFDQKCGRPTFVRDSQRVRRVIPHAK